MPNTWSYKTWIVTVHNLYIRHVDNLCTVYFNMMDTPALEAPTLGRGPSWPSAGAHCAWQNHVLSAKKKNVADLPLIKKWISASLRWQKMKKNSQKSGAIRARPWLCRPPPKLWIWSFGQSWGKSWLVGACRSIPWKNCKSTHISSHKSFMILQFIIIQHNSL